jgi:hypothetical protein
VVEVSSKRDPSSAQEARLCREDNERLEGECNGNGNGECNGNGESQRHPPFAQCAKDGAPGNSGAKANDGGRYVNLPARRTIFPASLSSAGGIMIRFFLSVLIATTLLLGGCTSTYYKAMEKLGKEKRDILVQRVKDTKKDQEQTKEQLKTTMESFQELTGFQGGSLEKSYKKLNSEYERSQAQADKLHERIKSIDQVSNDLFAEWQTEINSMQNAGLKKRSTGLLQDAKVRQATYMKAMNKTEAQMTPVLTAFHDQVLYLKHNLNARAIGSLKGTSTKINTDVTALMASIDASMQEADKLISSLSNTGTN